MRRGLLAPLLFLAAGLAPVVAGAAEVARFTPQGTVKQVRQVGARFSEPMVPLGDPRGAPDPFELDCPETGAGRWVDSRNWVYDFARDLPAGVRCRFRLRSGLVSLAGAPVSGRQEFAFSTGGPAILDSSPPQGATAIDEEQAFVLTLDADPTPDSLLAHVGFAVEGVADRVGFRILAGRDREAILRSRYGPDAARRPARALVLLARQRFPSRARVSLVWGTGVATASGVTTEQDQVLPFQVRGRFAATFHCERENPRAGCVPVSPMSVALSAPTAWHLARRIALVASDGRRWTPAVDEGDTPTTASRVTFKPPFPESTAFQVELPADLGDDAGRPLANAASYPLRVRTEAFPPLAKFAARFGIIEWKAGALLPVTVRNLEENLVTRLLRVDQALRSEGSAFLGWVRGRVLRIPLEHSADILPWLRKVGAADREVSVFGTGETPAPAAPPASVTLPRPDGTQDFQVVGLGLANPGLYVVELESPRLGASLLGKPRPMFVPTAALVTNLAVHWKWGRESSLAWVTALDTGRPVQGARVTVYDCRGTVLWRGVADGQGIARVAALPARSALPRCPVERRARVFFDWAQTRALTGLDEGLFVVAQTHEDLSFVHSSWDQGIEGWRFQLPEESETAPVIAHTVLDRPLFRAGETVHMRHVLRAHALAGFAPVPEGERPSRVSIRHQGSREKYDFPVAWAADGTASGTWTIPRETKLGRYEVVLVRPAPARPTKGEGAAEIADGEEESGRDVDLRPLPGRGVPRAPRAWADSHACRSLGGRDRVRPGRLGPVPRRGPRRAPAGHRPGPGPGAVGVPRRRVRRLHLRERCRA